MTTTAEFPTVLSQLLSAAETLFTEALTLFLAFTLFRSQTSKILNHCQLVKPKSFYCET